MKLDNVRWTWFGGERAELAGLHSRLLNYIIIFENAIINDRELMVGPRRCKKFKIFRWAALVNFERQSKDCSAGSPDESSDGLFKFKWTTGLSNTNSTVY